MVLVIGGVRVTEGKIMKEILGKSIFEIDFSGLKASVIFWLVATYQVDIKEYDTMVQSQNCYS